MPTHQVVGTPGPKTERSAAFRRILKGDHGKLFLPGGIVIDGSKARDPLNTADISVLRAGMVMGKITASGKYAPSIIGLVTADYTSGGTSLTVSAATATELVRRVGSSGTFKLTHAPTATGTVVPLATVTYSAVNTGTGVITITDIGANVDEGAILGANDGSATPLGLLPDGTGYEVNDIDGNNLDAQGDLLIGGIIDSSQIVNWPAAEDTTLVAWLKSALNAASASQFVFDDAF